MSWDRHITLALATSLSRQPFSKTAGQLTATSIRDPTATDSLQRRHIPPLLMSKVSVPTGMCRLRGSRMVYRASLRSGNLLALRRSLFMYS
jgi:hypothetical protein